MPTRQFLLVTGREAEFRVVSRRPAVAHDAIS